MLGHALLPLSAICHNIPVSNWVSRAVVFVRTNGHFTVVRQEGVSGGGGVGNGCRLMHNEFPHYANELQQPLSYVPQNKLWLALMAKFCIS